jgi:hypothetical protein
MSARSTTFAACALVGSLLAMTGCQATYTSIRREPDSDTYYMTRLKQSPFSAWGTLLRCEANKRGTTMTCKTVGEP